MSVPSRLLLIAIVAGVAACEPLAPPAAPAPVVIDLPAPLVSAGLDRDVILFNPQVHWSPDGGTIYYLDRSAPISGIRAVDATTGATRSVSSEPGSFGALRVGGGGEYVYATRQSDIVRIPAGGGQAEILDTGASGTFALSANGRMLAWSRNDSLHVRDLVTGQTRGVARQGEPILVSDDGEHIAYRSGWEHVAATSMMTGATTAFAARAHDVRWSGSRFEVAGLSASGFELVTERQPGALAQILRYSGHTIQGVDWSPDGRYVAATWVTICRPANNPPGTCHAQLLLIDTTTGAVATLVTSDTWLGRPNFSPDGRRIAFTGGGRLYVRNRGGES